MPLVNDPDLIKAQYRNGDKLDIRIRLHQKYSLNKEPFGEWIHAHYHLAPGMRVLELGCGTGSMWAGKEELAASFSRLVLTDFSAGMLEEAKANLAGTVHEKQIDYWITDILLGQYCNKEYRKGYSVIKRVA